MKERDPKPTRASEHRDEGEARGLDRRSFLGGTLAAVLFTAIGSGAAAHERKRQENARRPLPIWLGHM